MNLLHLVAFPWKVHGMEGAWETSGIRFCSSNQDARIPCVFQVLRPISVHTYPCQLQGGRVRGRRQIIPIPRARVTEHVVLERTCSKCGQRWAPEPDWGALTVGRHRMGISVQSEVNVLLEECRLPFGVIQRYLKWRYGLRLSVGELAALTHGAAERGQEEYAGLRQEIRASPVVYGDETGWREDGRNGYLWSFSTLQGALLPPSGQPGKGGGWESDGRRV